MAPRIGSRWFAKERVGTLEASGSAPTEAELAWAAGFIEGEGCFTDNGSHLRVRATQKNKEPLDRLVELFGGRLNHKKNGRRQNGEKTWLWDWQINGKRAFDVMKMLGPWMSQRRKDQINAAFIAAGIRGDTQ